MLVAQARWLPQYRQEIAASRRRLRCGPHQRPRPVRGHRLPIRSVTAQRRQRDARRR
jgi:hypothetical protein